MKTLTPLEQIPVFTTQIKAFINWTRKNALWPLPFGTACCGIEYMAVVGSHYDISRMGAEVVRFSPRQADLLIVAGTITDLWIDRADTMVRYLEVKLAGAEETRLIPMPMLRVCKSDGRTKNRVEVSSLKAAQFPLVPRIKLADRITTLEEEKISAFYAGGRLYADPKRAEPLL